MCTHSCLLYFFSSCSFGGYSTAAQFLPTRGSSPRATRSTRTSRHSSPSRRPCGAQLQREFRTCFTLPHTLYQTFVNYVINNIRTRFIISFYVICDVIYCSFCCIYVWLDPGTYMIARFMSFYKPGVTVGDAGCNLLRNCVAFAACFHLFPLLLIWNVQNSKTTVEQG